MSILGSTWLLPKYTHTTSYYFTDGERCESYFFINKDASLSWGNRSQKHSRTFFVSIGSDSYFTSLKGPAINYYYSNQVAAGGI